MCGRATLHVDPSDIRETLRHLGVTGEQAEGLDLGPLALPRYNLAPTQPVLLVRPSRATPDAPPPSLRAGPGPGLSPGSGREARIARWGLVPHWTKPGEEKRIASRCIQARLETAPRAPAFRDAFRGRRCLIVVDGFFEWETLEDGTRAPHHLRREDGKPFTLAGLWSTWRDPRTPSAEPIRSCAVVTVAARGVVGKLHDRMPLVVGVDDADTWLTGSANDLERLAARPPDLVDVPVSTWVNDVRHDDPRCVEPVAGLANAAPGPPAR